MNPMSTIGYIINETTAKNIEFKPIEENSRGFLTAEGILQEAEKENRNRRCYATKDLADELMAPRQQELVSLGNFKGEAGHPMDINLNRQQTIEPKYVQVWFTKLWMDNNLVKAHFRGTNNSYGHEFNDDLKDGQKPSFSLRALGRIQQINGKAYVKGLKIVTYDRVYWPSHDKAYTQKIIREGACEYQVDESFNPRTVAPPGNRMILTEAVIQPIMNQDVINYIMSESANLQTIMKNFDTLYQTIQVSEDGKYVSLTDTNHDTLVVHLEQYIKNEIMDFCAKTNA